jgi:hypothetical protein
MTDSSVPAFVVAICFVSGLLLIVAAIPLWLRRVPPNSLYGVRFASTLAHEDIWYEVNARCGRDLAVIGAGYVALLAIMLLFARSWIMPVRLLVPTALFAVALIVDSVALRVASVRLLDARNR